MKGAKVGLVILAVVLGVTGIYAYRRYKANYSKPDIKLVSVDWPAQTAVVSINGKSQEFKPGMGLNVNVNYSIQMTDTALTVFKRPDSGTEMLVDTVLATKPT